MVQILAICDGHACDIHCPAALSCSLLWIHMLEGQNCQGDSGEAAMKLHLEKVQDQCSCSQLLWARVRPLA